MANWYTMWLSVVNLCNFVHNFHFQRHEICLINLNGKYEQVDKLINIFGYNLCTENERETNVKLYSTFSYRVGNIVMSVIRI